MSDSATMPAAALRRTDLPKLSLGTKTAATLLAIVAAVVLPQLFHVIGAVSGIVGYKLLYGQSTELISLIQSIAAGALLVVVINEMVPIAIRGVQRWAGVLAASGFVFSAAITWISGG